MCDHHRVGSFSQMVEETVFSMVKNGLAKIILALGEVRERKGSRGVMLLRHLRHVPPQTV